MIPMVAKSAHGSSPRDELMYSINEEAEEWLNDLAITKSGRTVKAYRTPLIHFQRYCTEKGKRNVEDLGCTDLPAFVRWLKKQGQYDRSTIALYVTALSQFYYFLLMEGIAPFSFVDYERLKERLQSYANGWKKKKPKVPDPQDMEKVFAKVKEYKACPRDRILRLRNIALLETLRSTGARVSEIACLMVPDIDYDIGTCVINGKGDKERLIFFDTKSLDAIREYLAARQVEPDLETPLWIRHDNNAGEFIEPLTTDAVRNMLTDLCIESGAEHITPHQFRHVFAITVLRGTHDLAVTQDLLGHSSPNTTRIYTQFLPDELRAIHEEVIGGT